MNSLDVITDPNDGISDERKWKKRKTEGNNSPLWSRWRDEREHIIYSSKLLHALHHVRRDSHDGPPRKNVVHEAADRILASTGRGRSRWSRAILVSCKRKLRLKKVKKRPKKPARRNEKVVVATEVEKKAKVLGRLVPGCRKLSFPTLLEEAVDYIAALEMQVKAMTALAEVISNISSHPTNSHDLSTSLS